MNFKDLCKKLESKIQSAYTEGITMEEAEKLAGQFLHAQILVSEEIKREDLNSRMRKAGLKAVRAAVYTEACSKADKKPTESSLEHILNMNELVSSEQDALDAAEVERDNLERYYNIFREGHIYTRSIAKGTFGA